MSKRRSEKQRPVSAVVQPTPMDDVPRDQVVGVGIRIVGLALRQLEYHEMEPSVAAVSPADASKLNIKMDVQGTINLFEPDLAEFMLYVKVEPDPSRKPLRVHAKISVLLKCDVQMTQDELMSWVNQLGVLIVFPYVREVISNVTSRGIFGPLYIDPIDVSVLLGTQSAYQAQKR